MWCFPLVSVARLVDVERSLMILSGCYVKDNLRIIERVGAVGVAVADSEFLTLMMLANMPWIWMRSLVFVVIVAMEVRILVGGSQIPSKDKRKLLVLWKSTGKTRGNLVRSRKRTLSSRRRREDLRLRPAEAGRPAGEDESKK